MAANYWESTQRKHWLFTKDELAAMRAKLEAEDPNLVASFPLPQLRHLNIYFNQQINRIGKRMQIRQQALATAQVYIKRFYTKVEIRRTNPHHVLVTALYLACKMEECPQHIRLMANEARGFWPTDFQSQTEVARIGECEFYLISEMSSHLIVHSPYRTLTSLQGELGLAQEDVNLAWSVINDHYMTDLPLLYPPHVIALTAILLALVLRQDPSGRLPGTAASNSGLAAASAALAQAQAQAQARAAMMAGGGQTVPGLAHQSSSSGLQAMLPPQSPAGEGPAEGNKNPRMAKVHRFAAWLSDSNIDIEAMVDCTQELISFYECHEQYNDKNTREQINRFVKARGLDK
ncbi:RNA polymerase II holoenzyme cyclin-like subunit [Neurospora tetraspora]|uniref:RNA polymerase II holoenzyme cyclin-like subunit n=1 Tax=Neurospora tetraspora TaxID=94610 RepID=A0AAE0JG44_9PEZI|nr:RNA polymerase II holoenzyme cyclin-like subunit [Neurospora tetraspora]